MVVAGRRHLPRSGGPAVKRLAAGTRRLVPDALRRDSQDRWAAAFGRIAGRPPRGLLPPAQPTRPTAPRPAASRCTGCCGPRQPTTRCLPPARPSLYGHLAIPGAGWPGAGVPLHPGHLPRAGRPATRRGTARPGNRADRAEPARRLHRNPRASPPGGAAWRRSARTGARLPESGRRPDAMDRPSLIVAATPIMTLIALFTGITLPFIAASRSGRSHAGGGAAGGPGADDTVPAGYLYVPAPATGKTPSGGWCGCWAATATRMSPREVG